MNEMRACFDVFDVLFRFFRCAFSFAIVVVCFCDFVFCFLAISILHFLVTDFRFFRHATGAHGHGDIINIRPAIYRIISQSFARI